MDTIIKEFLLHHEDLLRTMCDFENYDDYDLPTSMADVDFEIVSDEDEYGCNFKGTQRILQLFFEGSDDTKPCIWIGNRDYSENLDKYPIYVLELSGDERSFESVGNFKAFMLMFANYYLENNIQNDDITTTLVKKFKKQTNKLFSDNTLDFGAYKLKVNDE